MSMILAEELDVDLDRVRFEQAPPNDALYANPLLQIQTTGASTSVRAFWRPLRQAGAVCRTQLIQAAAARWGVDPRRCTARSGVVSHASPPRTATYGQLVDDAAKLPAPSINS